MEYDECHILSEVTGADLYLPRGTIRGKIVFHKAELLLQ